MQSHARKAKQHAWRGRPSSWGEEGKPFVCFSPQTCPGKVDWISVGAKGKKGKETWLNYLQVRAHKFSFLSGSRKGRFLSCIDISNSHFVYNNFPGESSIYKQKFFSLKFYISCCFQTKLACLERKKNQCFLRRMKGAKPCEWYQRQAYDKFLYHLKAQIKNNQGKVDN